MAGGGSAYRTTFSVSMSAKDGIDAWSSGRETMRSDLNRGVTIDTVPYPKWPQLGDGIEISLNNSALQPSPRGAMQILLIMAAAGCTSRERGRESLQYYVQDTTGRRCRMSTYSYCERVGGKPSKECEC